MGYRSDSIAVSCDMGPLSSWFTRPWQVALRPRLPGPRGQHQITPTRSLGSYSSGASKATKGREHQFHTSSHDAGPVPLRGNEKSARSFSDRSFFMDVHAGCPCQNVGFLQGLEGLTEVFVSEFRTTRLPNESLNDFGSVIPPMKLPNKKIPKHFGNPMLTPITKTYKLQKQFCSEIAQSQQFQITVKSRDLKSRSALQNRSRIASKSVEKRVEIATEIASAFKSLRFPHR